MSLKVYKLSLEHHLEDHWLTDGGLGLKSPTPPPMGHPVSPVFLGQSDQAWGILSAPREGFNSLSLSLAAPCLELVLQLPAAASHTP